MNSDEEVIYNDAEFLTVYEKLILSARKSFLSFLYVMYPQMVGQAYVIGDLHEYLAELVDDVFNGTRARNQSVSVPPQHGKSRLLAVRVVAYLIGARPNIAIAMTGFSHDLLKQFLKEVKEIVASESYQRIFPNIEPRSGSNRAGEVEFNNGSTVVCKSCGSKLTGRRVDWLIVDDPHAGRREADSPAERKKVHEWFFADCVSRLAPDAATFIISTRWHPEDLHAKVTEEESRQAFIDQGFEDSLFEITNIPAICNDPYDDPLGREEGEACFPEQRPIDFLKLRKLQFISAGESNEWWSQYQGEPKPKGGDLADITKITKIKLSEVPTDIEWVRGIDPAISAKQNADFTTGALCAARLDSKGMITEFYLIDMFKKRGAYAKRKNDLENLLDYDNLHNNVNRVGIEGVSGFEAIVQETKTKFLGRISVSKKNFRGDKVSRAQPWFNLIEAGRFYVVDDPKWTDDFLVELEHFPSGKHDDQIDAVSIGREVLTSRTRLLLA